MGIMVSAFLFSLWVTLTVLGGYAVDYSYAEGGEATSDYP